MPPACDLIVFTADWIPDHEIAVLGGIDLDEEPAAPASTPAHRAPRRLRRRQPPARRRDRDIAALSGRHITEGVIAHLDGTMAEPAIPIRCTTRCTGSRPTPAHHPGTAPRHAAVSLLRARHGLIWPRIEITEATPPMVRPPTARHARALRRAPHAIDDLRRPRRRPRDRQRPARTTTPQATMKTGRRMSR